MNMIDISFNTDGILASEVKKVLKESEIGIGKVKNTEDKGKKSIVRLNVLDEDEEDYEEIREVIEDNMGVEILDIDGVLED